MDPKFTKSHFSCFVFYPYIVAAEKLSSRTLVDSMLHEIGVERSYLEKKSNWVSVELFDLVLSKLKDRGINLSDLNRESALVTYTPEYSGVNYYLMKHFANMKQVLMTSEKILKRYNNARVMEVDHITKGSAYVKVLPKKGYPLPVHRESCVSFHTCFEEYIRIVTGVKGRVVKTSCSFDGDEYCSYEFSWTERQKALTTLAPLLSGVLLSTFASMMGAPLQQSVIGGLVAMIICLALRFKGQATQRTDEIDELIRMQEVHEERYISLQSEKESALKTERLANERLASEVERQTRQLRLLNLHLSDQAEQLRQGNIRLMQDAAKGELLTALAHELSNVIFYMQLLLESPSERSFKVVHGGVEKLASLQKLLLGNRSRQAMKVLTIESALNDTLIHLRNRIESMGVKLLIDIDPETKDIFFKEQTSSFFFIMQNIVKNAADAVANANELNRTIKITTFKLDKAIQILVTDHGCGMNSEAIQNILNFKAESTKTDGHGLGMRLVLSLCRQNEFGLFIESEVGRGTTVKLLIPCHTPIDSFFGSNEVA